MAVTALSNVGLPAILARDFLSFELLPSLTLHAAQAEKWMPSAGLRQHSRKLSHLHRHWSAALRKEAALEAVTDISDPALPLAMLPGERFDRLIMTAGAVQVGQRLRRCIVRDEVAFIRQQIGDEPLDFVLGHPEGIEVGEAFASHWKLSAVEITVRVLGTAALATVFNAASPPVGRRGLLRLPPSAATTLNQTQDAARTLRLFRSLLIEIEPQWLSLFPVSR